MIEIFGTGVGWITCSGVGSEWRSNTAATVRRRGRDSTVWLPKNIWDAELWGSRSHMKCCYRWPLVHGAGHCRGGFATATFSVDQADYHTGGSPAATLECTPVPWDKVRYK